MDKNLTNIHINDFTIPGSSDFFLTIKPDGYNVEIAFSPYAIQKLVTKGVLTGIIKLETFVYCLSTRQKQITLNMLEGLVKNAKNKER
jgi:hypothetical protein